MEFLDEQLNENKLNISKLEYALEHRAYSFKAVAVVPYLALVFILLMSSYNILYITNNTVFLFLLLICVGYWQFYQYKVLQLQAKGKNNVIYYIQLILFLYYVVLFLKDGYKSSWVIKMDLNLLATAILMSYIFIEENRYEIREKIERTIEEKAKIKQEMKRRRNWFLLAALSPIFTYFAVQKHINTVYLAMVIVFIASSYLYFLYLTIRQNKMLKVGRFVKNIVYINTSFFGFIFVVPLLEKSYAINLTNEFLWIYVSVLIIFVITSLIIALHMYAVARENS